MDIHFLATRLTLLGLPLPNLEYVFPNGGKGKLQPTMSESHGFTSQPRSFLPTPSRKDLFSVVGDHGHATANLTQSVTPSSFQQQYQSRTTLERYDNSTLEVHAGLHTNTV
jgi:hypothetical protein